MRAWGWLVLGLVGCGGRMELAQPACVPAADGVERCNGEDDDCDGLIDEQAVDAPTWYYDGDRDGWGVEDESRERCEVPDWFVARAGDCDDSEPLVNPGLEEVCGDGLDNDCDGTANHCGLEGTGEPWAVLWGTRHGGRAGSLVEGVGDLDGDGLDDMVVNDQGAWLVTSVPEGELTLPELEGAWRLPDTWGGAMGDLTGDGHPEVSLGDHLYSTPLDPETWEMERLMACPRPYGEEYVGCEGLSAGELTGAPPRDLLMIGRQVLQGPVGPDVDAVGLLLDAEADRIITDLDGDGVDELGVADPNSPDLWEREGKVWLLSAPEGDVALDDVLQATLTGDTHDLAGTSYTGVGDTDGDGYGDLLVGAPGNDALGGWTGAAYLLRGPVQGKLSLVEAAEATLMGEDQADGAGLVVAPAGDVNADGFADVLVSAPYADAAGPQGGKVYLQYGPISGTIPLERADFTLYGDEEGRTGRVVASAGDLDGDGYGDVLLGAERASPDDTLSNVPGATYLYMGGPGL